MSEVAPAPTGSSILTAGIPLDAPAPGNGGNPSANGTAPASGGTPHPSMADRPEWLPEKYWDGEKKSGRYEDLAKGYTHLEKLLGTEKVPIPTSDDDQEAWDRWYKAAGRPDSTDAYEFTRPDQLPDGLGYDEDLEKHFRARAYGLGLNKKQATGLYEDFVKTQIERHGAYQTSQKNARIQAEDAMRREFGSQFDAKMQKANVAMAAFADAEFRQRLDKTGLGNDPDMIRTFIKIGEQMTGDTRLPKAEANGDTSGDVRSKIADYRKKYDAELRNPDHPSHKVRVENLYKLHQHLSALSEAGA